MVNIETQSQIDDLVELRNTHRRRLKELRLSAATTGAQTPAHVNMEIETIEGQINEIERTIGRLHQATTAWIAQSLKPDSAALVATPEGSETQSAAIGQYIFMLEDSVRKEFSGIYHLLETDKEADTKDRRKHQRINKIFYLLVIILMCTLIIVVLLK